MTSSVIINHKLIFPLKKEPCFKKANRIIEKSRGENGSTYIHGILRGSDSRTRNEEDSREESTRGRRANYYQQFPQTAVRRCSLIFTNTSFLRCLEQLTSSWYQPKSTNTHTHTSSKTHIHTHVLTNTYTHNILQKDEEAFVCNESKGTEITVKGC